MLVNPQIKSRNKKFKLHFRLSTVEQKREREKLEQLQFVNTPSWKNDAEQNKTSSLSSFQLSSTFAVRLFFQSPELSFNCTAENGSPKTTD